MRFDVDDIGKKTKHHATECSRYLVDLDKVCMYVCTYVCTYVRMYVVGGGAHAAAGRNQPQSSRDCSPAEISAASSSGITRVRVCVHV